jgi:hypothetical protein
MKPFFLLSARQKLVQKITSVHPFHGFGFSASAVGMIPGAHHGEMAEVVL